MIRRPPRSTPFPTRRSSDLEMHAQFRQYPEALRSAASVAERCAGAVELAGEVYLPSARLQHREDRKSTRLNSSHANISYAVFCLKKQTRPSARATSSVRSPN